MLPGIKRVETFTPALMYQISMVRNLYFGLLGHLSRARFSSIPNVMVIAPSPDWDPDLMPIEPKPNGI